jgi:uncharacterized DUF497 family protein
LVGGLAQLWRYQAEAFPKGGPPLFLCCGRSRNQPFGLIWLSGDADECQDVKVIRLTDGLYCTNMYEMKREGSAPTEFDWDKGNIAKNQEKHKVGFIECEQVFFNKPLKIYRDKVHSQLEKRYIALGITDRKRKLLISFTIRNNKIRVISARDASRKERSFYEAKKNIAKI